MVIATRLQTLRRGAAAILVLATLSTVLGCEGKRQHICLDVEHIRSVEGELVLVESIRHAIEAAGDSDTSPIQRKVYPADPGRLKLEIEDVRRGSSHWQDVVVSLGSDAPNLRIRRPHGAGRYLLDNVNPRVVACDDPFEEDFDFCQPVRGELVVWENVPSCSEGYGRGGLGACTRFDADLRIDPSGNTATGSLHLVFRDAPVERPWPCGSVEDGSR